MPWYFRVMCQVGLGEASTLGSEAGSGREKPLAGRASLRRKMPRPSCQTVTILWLPR